MLFQCPASFRPERENINNLRSFFSRVKRDEFQFAWEPRGEWNDDLVGQLCGELDLIHCVDPFKAEQCRKGAIYWRLHGRGGYSYRYSDEDLAELKQQLYRHGSDLTGPAYILFNNIWMKDDASKFSARLKSDV